MEGQVSGKNWSVELGYVKVSKFWLNSLELQLIQEEKPIVAESKSLCVAWSSIILCPGFSKGYLACMTAEIYAKTSGALQIGMKWWTLVPASEQGSMNVVHLITVEL